MYLYAKRRRIFICIAPFVFVACMDIVGTKDKSKGRKVMQGPVIDSCYMNIK